MIRPNLRSPGCHDLVSNQAGNDLISIIIPFRDRAELTQTCVESIKKYGSDKIKHEIILIDNGSTETETLSWIKSITAQKNISSIRINEPFNFSRLNNKARSQCQGNYLLFLNNDIEFRSEQVFDQLLALSPTPRLLLLAQNFNIQTEVFSIRASCSSKESDAQFWNQANI